MGNKLIAMIPARAGSKRVPKKNIRMINGKPLISYVIETVSKINEIDEIYVNTDDEVIKDLVQNNYPKIKIYHRKPEHATDKATNDEFMYDFLKNTQTNSVIQVLPTSPFITSEEIYEFISKFKEEKLDTLISTKKNQIECVYQNKPLNFDKLDHTKPSQSLEPIYSYACSLMLWNKERYISNYHKGTGAYHGGEGRTSFFELKGYSTIDIDNEEDFLIAEVIAKSKDENQTLTPSYYDSQNKLKYDADVKRILPADGILLNFFDKENEIKTNVFEVIKSLPSDSSWSYTIVNTKSNRSTLLAQLPGEGNRRHYHSDWDEWWFILQGEWEFEYNKSILKATKGDIILLPRNVVHKITAIGTELAIRMAVSRDDIAHIYTENDYVK